MIPNWVGPLFLAAAIYDLLLGACFALAFRTVYERFGITLPNHDAYVQLPAALIAIFGIGFLMVWRDPERNRGMIVLGVLLKLAFSGIVLAHWFFGGIPVMWVPFAVIDVLFMFAFLAALRAVPAQE